MLQAGLTRPRRRPASELRGRDAERARIGGLLRATSAGRSGALVLRGEPGIGKTAMLEDTVRAADDVPVLQAIGVESESELAYAGLHQLLAPILGGLERLPRLQAEALASAFGLSSAGLDDRFRVSLAALNLLTDAAEERGLLCAIDDAQWLDRCSADAMVFVARRLEAEGILMLIAARAGEASDLETRGLPELWLGPLSDDAASDLLTDRAGRGVAAAVRATLLERSGGNPLALTELATLLSEDQLAGRAPILEPFPVGDGVAQAFLGDLGALSDDATRLLAVAAAEDTGDLQAILEAAALLDVDGAATDELELAGIVRIDGSSLTFRHPLLRSAAYRRIPSRLRRQAHRSLAAVLRDERAADRRTWHRAAAAQAPDEKIAAELERSANSADRRSGHAAAAAALERAAQLSEDDESRGRRLLGAAEASWRSGHTAHVGLLLDRAQPLLTAEAATARAAALRGDYEMARGAPADAYHVWVATAVDVAEKDPRGALRLLLAASEAATWSGNAEWAARAAELAIGLGADDEEERFVVALLAGTAALLSGDIARATSQLRRAHETGARVARPPYLIPSGSAAGYLADHASAHALFSAAVARGRERGSIGELPLGLLCLAEAEAQQGRFASALAHATEGRRLARDTRLGTGTGYHETILARISAVQGREAECRERARRAIAAATARGLALTTASATWALGQLELAQGRPDEALTHLAAVARPCSGFGHPLVALISAPDLIEAAARARRADEAAGAMQALDHWAVHADTAWPAAAAARCRALLADGSQADRQFDEALRRHQELDLPFEQARTQLLYAEHLRRSRRRKQARPHLRSALMVFEAVGARPWAQRTRAELRASGQPARTTPDGATERLTAQELQIARFVTEGASNREVAAKLFLSHRTVEYHLRNVFTKLQISSRGQLAGVLAQYAG